MKLNKMNKEELETMSYTDMAEIIIKESKKSLNTPDIFKKICKLLELTDEEYAESIGDFYTSLTTDKRFILLDNACWDLKDKHKLDIVLNEDDDEEDDEEIIEEAENEEDNIEETEDSDDNIDESINEEDDDLEDLTILDEEEMEE